MKNGPETERLLEALERLHTHVESVRSLSVAARDDVASVLHLLVGEGDGYGLVRRASIELAIDLPRVPSWGSEISETVDGQPVRLAFRTSPSDDGQRLSLLDHLSETCLRFAVPGLEPEANWTYLDLVKKVRNKFGSHSDNKPPRWLEELRYYPAADADVLTLLLWRAGELTLSSVRRQLVSAGLDTELYEPQDYYLDGIDLSQVSVSGTPAHLDVRAELTCASWASGRRRAIIGGAFADKPFILGLEADARLSTALGQEGESVADLAEKYRLQGLPKVGRNKPCPCGSDRKFKFCHGRSR